MSPVVVARIDRRRRLLLTGMAAGLTSVAHAQSLQPGLAVASRPLVLGEIALSFHAASAGVVRRILMRDGVAHSVVQAPHEQIYRMLGEGRIEMAVSAWLPGSHGEYIRPYETDLVKLGALYEPYALWGVPDTVPESDVREVADLLKPEVVARMNPLIQGIGPGAGISRFSREIFARYGLDAAGYMFRNGSLKDCTDAFEQAVAQGRWAVVPLWHPQYLHNRYRIRELAEPHGLLRGKDAATMVVRRAALPLLPERTLATLQRMRLGNAVVANLDDRMARDGRSALDAARQWMDENPATVAAWG